MSVAQHRAVDRWPLLSAGFRPFFLAAGVWAAVAMVVWTGMLRGAVELPTAFGPFTWHFHELLFGFVAAAIAGFLLTAVPNWTGRAPLRGAPLAGLLLLWLGGRLAVACSAWIGPVPAMAADLAFLLALAAVVAREVWAVRARRNYPLVVALALLVASNAAIHLGATGQPAWEAAGERLAIATVVALISLIGGRIVPSFTTNWLRQRKDEMSAAEFGAFDRAALAIGAAALAAWVVSGLNPYSGVLLLLAGAAHAWRLGRWRGGATSSEPLLWILHLGYAWLPLGFILLGLTAWRPELASTALHAFTAGAMGTMILAVMTRASLGHTGRTLTAGPGTVAVYLLVTVAAAARLAAPFLGAGYPVALDLAAGAWIAAFALFVALYLPLYARD